MSSAQENLNRFHDLVAKYKHNFEPKLSEAQVMGQLH